MNMAETIPADYIDRPARGYIYVSLMSPHGRQQVANLLHQLQDELPGVIWPMPPSALHVTLAEIIQSRKEYTQDKDALFEEHRQEYERQPERILARMGQFAVTFNAIEASEQAIIVRGIDQGQFQSIRSRLVAEVPFPDETKSPPDIIHSSIARYKKSVDLEHVQQIIARHALAFEEPITQFHLMKTVVPPLLKYETLRAYQLPPSGD